jgi:ParB-like chromosome segregation protein Spo0J
MEIKEINLKELMPYENNPRKNEDAVQYVKSSIEQFGFKVPIIIDKDNIIVAGHTRYEAAKELGFDKVPCIIADDLTEEQIKAFRLADNKVSEFSKWDNELLNTELSDLTDIDMGAFGFIDLADIDIDSFFTEGEEKAPKEAEKKEIKCPHCGMYFTEE